MNDPGGLHDEPRWLRVAAALHADPDPATLERARARVVALGAGPAWVRWLARPAALAAAATLLVVSIVAGELLLANAGEVPNAQLTSAMLADDGTYGLPATPDAPAEAP